MADYTLPTLSAELKNYFISEECVSANQRIRSAYRLSEDQFQFILKLVLDIALRRVQVLDLLSKLASMPGVEKLDSRALALDIAMSQLWPLQSFLGQVDVLITRLGGRVPKPVELGIEESASSLEWVHGSAQKVLQKNRSWYDLYVTQKPIHNSEGRLRPPTITNWLQDYLHTVGADGGGSLKRSQYLARSANALVLNDSEKQNLLNFLVSYEDNAIMFWRVAEDQYVLIQPDMPADQKKEAVQQQSTRKLSEFTAMYVDVQQKYAAIFYEKKKGIELEINGNVKKIADIVWDSLGLGETERCLSALDLLIDHHWLLETLKTDHRFQGIVSRFIGVKYGTEARNTWNGDMTGAVILALFWRLVLMEKLNLNESAAAILADYYRKRLLQTASPMYLDLKSGAFLFREVAYKDRALTFV